LDITYLGHSAFRLRGKDVTVVTDPFPPSSGSTMGKVTANLVTISHKSPNHAYFDGVGGDPRCISGPGEYEVAAVLLAGVATELERGVGPVNTAYVMRFDDLSVCHLGHISSRLTDTQVEDLGHIDILLVPVGGGGALGPAEAADVVSQLEPSIVIPMHYRVDGSAVDGLDPVDNFCRDMGTKEFVPAPKLTVSKSSLTPEIQLVVLESRRT
jgi:L-ascorbate metabolism protein UlaG (beta-lactamase superfamily)